MSATLCPTTIITDRLSHVQQRLVGTFQRRRLKDHDCAALVASIQEVSRNRSKGAIQLLFIRTEKQSLPELDSSMVCNLKES